MGFAPITVILMSDVTNWKVGYLKKVRVKKW